MIYASTNLISAHVRGKMLRRKSQLRRLNKTILPQLLQPTGNFRLLHDFVRRFYVSKKEMKCRQEFYSKTFIFQSAPESVSLLKYQSET